MSNKVKIDPVALDQLLEIRDSGETNMFDFNTVQHAKRKEEQNHE